MPNYYNASGQKINAKKYRQYLAKLEAAQAAGKEYTGKKYYTAEELSRAYGGYTPEIVNSLGNMRGYLTETPAAYNAMNEEQMAQAARDQYAGQYNAQLTAAQNKYDADKLAYTQQLAALDPAYDAMVAGSDRQYQQSADSLQGTMASRGLGRSSYAGQMQANMQQAGVNAANAINAERAGKQNDINQQITGLGTAHNATVAQLASDRAANENAYLTQLRQQEYQNNLASQQARNEYLLQLQALSKKKKGGKASGAGSSLAAQSGGSSSGSSGDGWRSTANKA